MEDLGRSLTEEEIEAIRHTITPVEKIRNGLSSDTNTITCAIDVTHWTRKESLDKLR